MTIEELKKAHMHSINNKIEILNSKICGCFYCGKIFKPEEICCWLQDKNLTALCPCCSTDAVIGDASGFKVTSDLLNELHNYWFG